MRISQRYLVKRDREILEFVDRYRIATDDMLAQGVFDLPTGNANVARVIRRLVRRGLLRKRQFCGSQSYIVLTRRGAGVINAADRTPRLLTEQSLPVVLAIAWYCVRTKQTRFTTREFQEKFPELWRPGFRACNYYLIDTDEGLKLGLFVVDRGGTAYRIRSKVRRVLRQRESIPEYMALINAGRFQVTVLTGLSAQQRNVERRLVGCSFRGIEVVTEVIPELGELLTVE